MIPACFQYEAMIDGYANHYGLDPAIVEEKDVIDLYLFQALRNREAVIMDRRTKK